MKKLSIVGKGYHTDEQVVGYYNTGDRMKYWAKLVRSGEAFGGFCSDLLSLLIPGLGPILVAGPLVAWIVAGFSYFTMLFGGSSGGIAKPDPQGCGYSCLVCGGQR